MLSIVQSNNCTRFEHHERMSARKGLDRVVHWQVRNVRFSKVMSSKFSRQCNVIGSENGELGMTRRWGGETKKPPSYRSSQHPNSAEGRLGGGGLKGGGVTDAAPAFGDVGLTRLSLPYAQLAWHGT